MTHRSLALALGLALATAACSRSSPEAGPRPAPPPPPAPAPAAAASLDGRTPLPLTAMMATHQKQEMRDHLRVVQEITGALARDDFDAIAASAARIAWSDKQAMMCKHMGAGAPGFTELGEHFHHTADGIVDAARRRDRAGVTTTLAATLETCVGCHDTYRQDVVDDATFARLGGAAAVMDHAAMHGP